MDNSNPLIIIPAHNEEKSIVDVILDIRQFLHWDIVVVDDASTDNTIAHVKQTDAKILPLGINLGAWGALQTGMRYALKKGYHQVVTMDADGQHLACEILKLFSKKDKADVIIGNYTQRGSFARHIAWYFFRFMTQLKVEDLTSGFRLYQYPALRLLALKEATLLEYQDLGVLLLLRQQGVSIKEVDVVMKIRKDGHSRVYSSWFAVCYYLLHTTILCISKQHSLSKNKIKEI